mmetsp:Transcript_33403/g.34035  ORF Transcript_33403/g.34035 Transcript_33403/m.34035 type:complete len:383 (+) Transcript_33403:262-1410(+)
MSFFKFIQWASGIKDENVLLALILTASVLAASYLFFIVTSIWKNSPSKRNASSPDKTDRDILETIFRENGGMNWAPEFRKNWMSKPAWETWKMDMTRNPFMSSPSGKWGGVEIDVIYGKDHVLELQMRDNVNFTGCFPRLFSLQYLISIDFDHCKLSGPIPKEIGTLLNLTYLNLSFNNFSGGIPEEIGNLTNLTFLNLNRNPLGGCIPNTIGKMLKLEHLWLANCKLTGAIPYDIGHLIELHDLVLCENKLTGKIPNEIGVLSKLDRLILSMNELSGKVPDSICQCKSLSLLYLDRNRFYGELPSDIVELSNLKELWLYMTHITIGGKTLTKGVERGLVKIMQNTDILVEQPTSPTRVLVRKQRAPSSPSQMNATRKLAVG